jgi:carbon-monoxide dehydrogenase large subunit
VGGGSYGSRSLTASGAALGAACTQVVEAARKAAAVYFGVTVAEVTFQDGLLGVGNRSLHLLDLAALLRDGGIVSDNDMPVTLDVTLTVTAPPSTFPNGCHVAEVEIDPETGELRLDRYCAVDDIGTVVNPLVAEGQMHGGIVQGIGQAVLECTVYDTEGQLLTGSFMDYALPRASDLPSFTSEFIEVSATTNPLGAKGCGEAGVAGALPAVVNAALDALAPLGIHHLDMPMTPARLWQVIHDARING